MIDKIIIVFILSLKPHTFLVSFHGNRTYQMKEKVICYIMIYGCYGLFCSLEFLRFFKIIQICCDERINLITLVIFMKVDNIC